MAISINWLIPRLMPGDPLVSLISQLSRQSVNNAAVYEKLTKTFDLDKPMFEQYLLSWKALFRGDLGISIIDYPTTVLTKITKAAPFSIGLALPALLLSFFFGNKLGGYAARRKHLDGKILPIGYVLMSMPYFWLAILLAWFFGSVLNIFPLAFAYSPSQTPNWSLSFILDYLFHWILPFLSLFIVQTGGWAIGMRNMIIYELEADYSKYLRCLGAPDKLIRSYSYKNAILPQITGLATQIGLVIFGTVATEGVFGYPGIGNELVRAIMRQDYFVVQGCFLFIVFASLIANFLIDVAYAFIDPRVRFSMVGD